MEKVYYPVIFTREDMGFSTEVIDLSGCYSEGDSFEEAYESTQDAIGLYLDGMSELPKPTEPYEVSKELSENEFMCVVEFSLMEYKKKHSSKSVKKTLSIPEWLNDEAERQHVNFSGILQDALKNKLGIR